MGVLLLIDERGASLFLSLGYMPDVKSDLSSLDIFVLTDRNNEYDQNPCYESMQESARAGVNVLAETFERLAASPGGTNHIVPLSGGLDSRLILGALLNLGLKDRITAVTFGMPGTLDFDIGRYIAEYVGVKHEAIDLRSIEINQEELIETAKEMDQWTWLFDAYYNSLIYQRFGKGVTYWSGFMGGESAGGALLIEDSDSWLVAIEQFNRKTAMAQSNALIHPQIALENLYPQKPFYRNTRLSYDEQLYLGMRQEFYIKPNLFKKGYDIKMPYIDPGWLKFILNAPGDFRRNKILYKEIIKQAYPQLAKIKTKNNYGLDIYASKNRIILQKAALGCNYLAKKYLWNINLKPTLNYLNFSDAILSRKDYRNLVKENIHDLGKRTLVDWIDAEKLLHHHLSERKNYGMELILLTALELNCKAKLS